jgi:YidC/Oxa1 family membrane protein insertase
MNKQEIAIVVLLFVALMLWGYVQKGRQPQRPRGETPTAATNAPATPALPAETALSAAPPESTNAPAAQPPVESAVPPAPGRLLPEDRKVLAGAHAHVTVSSWGGGVTMVELPDYPRTLHTNAPVLLDFAEAPALSMGGIAGLTTNDDFEVSLIEGGRTARVTRVTKEGLAFERTLALGDEGMIEVTDVFSNRTAAALTVPANRLVTGPMRMMEGESQTRGMAYLGIDTLGAVSGEKAKYWGAKLPELFGVKASPFSCVRTGPTPWIPPSASRKLGTPVLWAAAKDKFFVQILAPESDSVDCEIQAGRDMAISNGLAVAHVSASIWFGEKVMQPGESATRKASYYVGPKKYSVLRALGKRRDDVMEFGFFRVVCKILLPLLTAIYDVVRNYGIAIIILTMVTRVVFWPITRKSTESMRRMQEIQPLVTKIREKYKDKPQKMNQEVMALYKEHKVNPMMGCLPMLLQIPVFIALFNVLRSAVELRYAGFLWIPDLSEPENLFAGTAFFRMIPFVGALNILPILMTATTVWQQKLTPSAGDPSQQKMMMIMPIVFLFILYNMASALVLYWTVSQCLAIGGLLWQRRKTAPSRTVVAT